MLRRLTFIGLALCLALWQMAGADPSITGMSGTPTHGESVTITGTAFGAKDPVAPYRYDNFESGTPGDRLADQASGGWFTQGIPGQYPEYNNARIRYSGTQSAYQDYTNGNWSCGIGLEGLPDTTLYFSGWFYMATTLLPVTNVKMLLIRNEDPGDYIWHCRLDQYPSASSGSQYVKDCNGLTTMQQNWMGAELWLDAWHRADYWFEQGTANGGDGVWSLYIDGSLWTEVSGTFRTDYCPIGKILIGHYYAASDTTSAQRWWDEMYVDYGRARVEIGDSSNWSNCARREIQVPTAWAAGEVSFTVNQGTYADSDSGYIYLVDSGGVADSSGYGMTFDEGMPSWGGFVVE